MIKDYDYYDIASYLASREYKMENSNKQVETDILEIIRNYLETQKLNRLESTIISQSILNNYSLDCIGY